VTVTPGRCDRDRHGPVPGPVTRTVTVTVTRDRCHGDRWAQLEAATGSRPADRVPDVSDSDSEAPTRDAGRRP
jgi:hypothetical protein